MIHQLYFMLLDVRKASKSATASLASCWGTSKVFSWVPPCTNKHVVAVSSWGLQQLVCSILIDRYPKMFKRPHSSNPTTHFFWRGPMIYLWSITLAKGLTGIHVLLQRIPFLFQGWAVRFELRQENLLEGTRPHWSTHKAICGSNWG